MQRFIEFGYLFNDVFKGWIVFVNCSKLKAFRTLFVDARFSTTEVFKFQENKQHIPRAAAGTKDLQKRYS